MAAIARRSIAAPVSRYVQLVAANDLPGTAASRLSIDVTGAQRVFVIQGGIDGGTDGTAGIDVVVISKDGGSNWIADPTLLALDSDDSTGTVVTALNAAGIEPVTTKAAVFKSGPHEGPTLLRINRKTGSLGGTTWVTGAPAVNAFAVGTTSGVPTSITHTSD